MSFTGEYRHSVDEKGRVAVPKSFRSELPSASEGKFVLSQGRDRTIEVHPLSEWKDYVSRTLHNLPRHQVKSRRALRYFFAQAAKVVPDSQGRILIPKPLRDHAGIGPDAVLAGAGDYIEVWEPKHYDEFMADAKAMHESDMTDLENQGWDERAQHGNERGTGVSPAGDGR